VFTGEILFDVKADGGKAITWKEHRLVTLRLAQAYKRINSRKYNRILQCGSSLGFRRYSNDSMKLHFANFCNLRLCPTCSWRRSKKQFAHVSKIMDSIAGEYEFLFLTLTCKNVNAEGLNSQIDKMYAAFKALCLRVRFKTVVHAWIRAFETNFNWRGEFHPHFHVVLAVDNSYFKDGYIEQSEWASMWQSCLRVDYKPIVDIRLLKASKKGKGKEVAEIAKYCVKPTSVMADMRETRIYNKEIQAEVKAYCDAISDSTILTLEGALHGRRLVGYGGMFKELHRKLNFSGDDELIHVTADGNGESSMLGDYEIEYYRWHCKARNYMRLAN